MWCRPSPRFSIDLAIGESSRVAAGILGFPVVSHLSAVGFADPAQRDVPIYMEWIGSLDGAVNAVAGVLPAALGASERDLGLICPAVQGGEAAWAGRIELVPVPDLLSAINHFRGTQVLCLDSFLTGAPGNVAHLEPSMKLAESGSLFVDVAPVPPVWPWNGSAPGMAGPQQESRDALA